jgi:AraC-like DNA-binding protein
LNRIKRWGATIINLRVISVVLALSLLPVLGFGTLMYMMGSHLIESEVNRSSFASMNQTSRQVEATIGQIESFSTQLALQSNFITLMDTGAEPVLGSMPLANEVKRDLTAIASSMEGIDSVAFIHLKQMTVISSYQFTSLDSGEYKDTSWMSYLQEALDSRKQSFWIAPRTGVNRLMQEERMLTYVRVLPFLYDEPKAVLLVNLSARYIRDMLGQFSADTAQGSMLLFNEKMELLANSGSIAAEAAPAVAGLLPERKPGAGTSGTYRLEHPDAPEMFATFKTSADNGWTYAMLVPVGIVSSSVALLKQIIIISTVLLSALAFITAYFSFAKFHNGIERLIRLFDPAHEVPANRKNETGYSGQIAYIETSISHLKREVLEVKAAWKEQLPLLRAHYLLSALVGNTNSLGKLAELYSGDFHLFRLPKFGVISLEMDALDDNGRFADKDKPLFLFAAANIINELFEGEYHAETLITHDHTVVIFNLPEACGDRELKDMAEMIRSSVKKYLRHTVTLSMGSVVSQFHELSRSYSESLRALRQNWLKPGDALLSGSAMEEKPSSLVRYPSAAEEAVQDGLHNGDQQRTEAALRQFMKEISAGSPPITIVKTYCLQLLVSVIRLAQEYQEDLGGLFPDGNPYDQFFKLEDQEAMAAWFPRAVFPPLLELIAGSKKKLRDEVVQRTFRIVEERYAQDLSLQALADELKMNPSYVSLIFKEETGETFIHYVTGIRVARAKELLARTDLTVQQIAREVGYGNAQHLIRVFKKQETLTPGEYRAALHSKGDY